MGTDRDWGGAGVKESNMVGPSLHFLVTGGTGFIGTGLVQSLLQAGHQVTIFTRQTISDTEHCRYVDSLENIL